MSSWSCRAMGGSNRMPFSSLSPKLGSGRHENGEVSSCLFVGCVPSGGSLRFAGICSQFWTLFGGRHPGRRAAVRPCSRGDVLVHQAAPGHESVGAAHERALQESRSEVRECSTLQTELCRQDHRSTDRPLWRVRRIGVEAFLIEEEDAGAEGQEHDGDAGGDAEAGGERRGTILATPYDDMTRDDDQKFQDAAFEQPGHEAADGLAGISEVQIEDDPPEQPQGAPKEEETGFLLKERLPEIVAANRESQGPNDSGRE